MITQAELLDELLRGKLLIVGDYRGSIAEVKGYVDRKSGLAINYIRALHLVECACRGPIDRAIITQRFPETIDTVEEAKETFTYIRGLKYLFYLESLTVERGQVFGRMNASQPVEVEVRETTPVAPSGAAGVAS